MRMHAASIYQQAVTEHLLCATQWQVWGHNSERSRKPNSNRRWDSVASTFLLMFFHKTTTKISQSFTKENVDKHWEPTHPQINKHLLLPLSTFCENRLCAARPPSVLSLRTRGQQFVSPGTTPWALYLVHAQQMSERIICLHICQLVKAPLNTIKQMAIKKKDKTNKQTK